jgi:hypothetical protein
MAILRGKRPALPFAVSWHFAIVHCLMLSGRAAAAQAAPGDDLEFRVKAAYLLNFSRYVTWPPDAFGRIDAPVRICVLGQDPFHGALDEVLANQRTQGREVQPLRVETPEEAVGMSCRVVYVGPDHRRSRSWERPLRDQPIVTVGEGEGFLDEGGMLGFVIRQETVRFAANLRAIHAARLEISSRVLRLATRVIPDRGSP